MKSCNASLSQLSEQLILFMYSHYSYSFCPWDDVAAIQCRDSDTKLNYVRTGQNVTCNVRDGLACIDGNQANGYCLDYEVRFYCNCSGEKTLI